MGRGHIVYIQNLREIRQAVWLLQNDLHSDLQWPLRSDLTSPTPHNLRVNNISYFMKFLDWRPPYPIKLHFKVLGIAMGTFWAPLPKIWYAQKVGRGSEGIHTKFERDSSSGLASTGRPPLGPPVTSSGHPTFLILWRFKGIQGRPHTETLAFSKTPHVQKP